MFCFSLHSLCYLLFEGTILVKNYFAPIQIALHDVDMRSAIICLLCVFVLTGSTAAVELPEIKVTNIRRVFHNGEHNAFTDLVRFNDQFYLTFRTCPDGHMVHPTASIIIMTSTDLKHWKQVHQFSVKERDTRDPHFLVFREKLFVYTGTWYCGETSPAYSEYTLNKHLGYAVWSPDGTAWSEPTMLEGTFGHYIWRANSFDGEPTYADAETRIST